MTSHSWLACFSVLAACQFGDDLALNAKPDGGTGNDSSVMQPTDAAIDSAAISCTLVPQGGCSGSTPACDIGDDGKTFCRGVTKQGTSNNHCAADTECKDGYTCIGDGQATHENYCARFCELDNHCLGVGSRCVNELTSSTTSMPLDVRVCSNACEPVAQSGCPTGMGCLPYEYASGDFTDCEYMGTKLTGDACGSSRECSPGAVCVGSSTTPYTCRPLCIVGSPSPCATTTQTCTGLANGLDIGSATYGVCR